MRQTLGNDMQRLGFNLEYEMEGLRSSGSVAEAERRFAKLQERIRKRFKRMALDHHPDVGGDEEFMKELSAARDRLTKWWKPRFHVEPPPQQQTVYSFTFNGNATGTTTSGATGTWGWTSA